MFWVVLLYLTATDAELQLYMYFLLVVVLTAPSTDILGHF